MNLERTILEALNLVHPRMLTESTLHGDVRLDAECSLTDLRGALRKLEGKAQVVMVSGEDRTRIKITQAGQARLAE